MNNNKINLDEELNEPFNFDNLNFNGSSTGSESSASKNSKNNDSALINELNDLANKATEKIKTKEAERQKAEAEKAKQKEYNKYIFIGIALAFIICFTFIFTKLGKKVNNTGKRTPSNKTISQNEFTAPVNSPANIDYNSNNISNIPAKPINRQGFESNPM